MRPRSAINCRCRSRFVFTTLGERNTTWYTYLMPIERQVECLGIRRLKVFIIGGVSVFEEDREYRAQLTLLGSSMTTLGRCIVEAGHDLLVCSPFPAAADAEAVRGAADALRRRKGALIEFHYPREQNVERELDKLLLSVPPETVRRYFYPTIVDGASIFSGRIPG